MYDFTVVFACTVINILQVVVFCDRGACGLTAAFEKLLLSQIHSDYACISVGNSMQLAPSISPPPMLPPSSST